MGRIEKSIEIRASPERVWEMLALDRWPEWMHGWKDAEYTSEVHAPEDKYRVGTTAHITEYSKYDLEIMDSLVNEKISYRTIGKGRGRTMTITYVLGSVEGGTKLTYGIDYEMPGGILGKTLVKLGSRAGEKVLEKELRDLKGILEK